jgi:hypothetical protein
MNLGLAVFAVGLVTRTGMVKQIGAPAVGGCLLVGLAVLAARLYAGLRSPAPEALAAA